MDDSPVEFVIPGHGEDYMDLIHTMLSLRIRVESEGGERTSVAAADVAKVGPVNHLLHSMFNQITKYPLTRVEVKTFTIHAGVVGESIDNAILGQLPKRIIVGFVDNKAFNGDRKLNPFNFKNYRINFFSLYLFSKDEPLFVEAYYTIFSGTDIHFLNEGNSRDDYANDYTLFAFDLTPDLSANCAGHWNLVDIRLPDIQISTETWVTLIEQFLMLILIIGRWMLPKGDLTRDQLSQLLLVYIGTAADIIEFFDSFKEDRIAREPVLVYLTLGIWAWSLTQFTVVLTATKSRKSRLSSGSVIRKKIRTETSCCSIDVWGIALNMILQVCINE
ncbi:Transmembrane protein 26 [Trachymyrmex cornetzi]|uniref:Transmembrane protein 26 n=1 Tax=Trachymyrmex cornetzi TaxID=471704 RepID=A0A151J2T8_9HYME|nr:Transmembrane protein 26 [Trachymyrmex cornetzi]